MATHPFKIVLDEKLAEIDFKELEGCTEPEIEIIRQAQNAACLPEVYRQLMLTVGKKDIDDLLVGSANYHIVQRFKSTFDDYFVNPYFTLLILFSFGKTVRVPVFTSSERSHVWMSLQFMVGWANDVFTNWQKHSRSLFLNSFRNLLSAGKTMILRR